MAWRSKDIKIDPEANMVVIPGSPKWKKQGYTKEEWAEFCKKVEYRGDSV